MKIRIKKTHPELMLSKLVSDWVGIPNDGVKLMMMELIASTSNPLVKQIRALRLKKFRDETGLFLVEGIHPIGEAIEASWDVVALVHAPEILESKYGQQLVMEHIKHNGNVIAFSKNLFTKIADKDHPQGLLAIIRKKQLNLSQLEFANFRSGAAVVSPQDPGNVGAVLRTLDATRSQALFLIERSVDPYHPSSVRASMGTIFGVPIIESSFSEFISWAKSHGVKVIGSSARATISYKELTKIGLPAVILMGNEQKGLSDEYLSACDFNVFIPMRGRSSSLNLAVATGILMYALVNI